MLPQLSISQINYLNIGLMFLSALMAIVLPFEVFLFSYAILGPLHYLTEISWLHDRKYFTKYKYDFVLLGLLGVAHSIISFYYQQKINWAASILFIGFAMALAMILFEKIAYRAVFFLVAVVALNRFYPNDFFKILFNIYVPTLVHVYVFTGVFILFGALKSKNVSGYWSFVIYLLCTFIVCFFPELFDYKISDYAYRNYQNFSVINSMTLYLLHVPDVTSSSSSIYNSATGIALMRFIAFAYTYHYLNWFSKTSVIQWHQISRMRFAIIILLWVLAVGLYVYDYRVGFVALYLLSFLHVLLEFPLNHQSFIGLGKELMNLSRSGSN